jgi:hypothetical protein
VGETKDAAVLHLSPPSTSIQSSFTPSTPSENEKASSHEDELNVTPQDVATHVAATVPHILDGLFDRRTRKRQSMPDALFVYRVTHPEGIRLYSKPTIDGGFKDLAGWWYTKLVMLPSYVDMNMSLANCDS